MGSLQTTIDELWDGRAEIDLAADDARRAIVEAIGALDSGGARVAEIVDDVVVVHEWLKRAILLYFASTPNARQEVGPFEIVDKVPLKSDLAASGVRALPGAVARWGAYIEPGVVLMPSFVNIGARVGSGTMVDTWATVGSCAQIGRNVHLSGGVGIGGVLEPPQATPTIIEDDCFIGSRCIVVEGVRVEREAVLGANVCLTQSTHIIDVTGSEPIVYKGRVPARSVVVPGTYPKKFAAGTYHVACALIIGQRKESTDKKVSLNDTLRDFQVAV